MTEPTTTQRGQLVILIHGIRTRARWEDEIKPLLEKELPGATICAMKYGRLDVFRFLFPWKTRQGPLNRVKRFIGEQHSLSPDARMSVIAHSFGTYIITHLLLNEPWLLFERLILCGSIVPIDFPWRHVRGNRDHPGSDCVVVNECGTRDWLPPMAQSVTWGYGASGTFGFSSPFVRDRQHDLTHSEFFTSAFVKKYWVPFLRNGEVVPSSWRPAKTEYKWKVELVDFFHLKYLAVLAALLLALTLAPLPVFCDDPTPLLRSCANSPKPSAISSVPDPRVAAAESFQLGFQKLVNSTRKRDDYWEVVMTEPGKSPAVPNGRETYSTDFQMLANCTFSPHFSRRIQKYKCTDSLASPYASLHEKWSQDSAIMISDAPHSWIDSQTSNRLILRSPYCDLEIFLLELPDTRASSSHLIFTASLPRNATCTMLAMHDTASAPKHNVQSPPPRRPPLWKRRATS